MFFSLTDSLCQLQVPTIFVKLAYYPEVAQPGLYYFCPEIGIFPVLYEFDP